VKKATDNPLIKGGPVSAAVFPGSLREKAVLSRAVVMAVVLVAADQAVKAVVSRLIPEGSVIAVTPFFSLTHINNPGAAWGMMAGKRLLLTAFSLCALAAIIVFLRALTEGCAERYYALFMVVSGIIGNSIDRVWRARVVDFLDFHAFGWHWPSFNIADSAITVGVTIFVVSSLLRKPRPR
jgi:signal peptidase II